jgi:hypothetical protein
MSYDHEAQKALDQKHLKYPKPGDYWHEMYCPIARILGIFNGQIVLQKVSGMQGKEISDTEPSPEVMSVADFKKWVSYDSMPDKTWCNVIPERYPPTHAETSHD